MRFSRLRGQEEARRFLGRLAEGRVFPSALRVEGPPGVGKALGVWEWVQGIFCTGEDPPCGTCRACRAVQALAHPDFSVVTPEDPARLPGQTSLRPFPYNPSGRALGIEAIRSLREMGGPIQAPVRVVVVMDADEMTLEAQNAFLKTLEEPPPRTVFVLITARPHGLLPTIRSRTVEVVFRPLPRADFEAALPEPYANVDVLFRASGGSPGMAREIATSGVLPERRKFLEVLEGEARGFMGFLLQEAPRWKPRDLWIRLQIWGQLVEDAWLVLQGAEPRTHRDLFRQTEVRIRVGSHHLMQALERLPFLDRGMVRNLASLDLVFSFLEPLLPEDFRSTMEGLRTMPPPDDWRGVVGW